MRPEQLTLVNIGPFQGTHRIDFSVLGDIFLIFGKTGAGKTTLFDALSYAFYGDVPGARSGNPRSMRSHFALDGEESSVELIFSLSGKKYRITRIPPNEKIGVRSGKIQAVPEEAALDEWRDGGWMSRTSTNKSDTDKSILSLIGLSAEEFS
ncbi:MAG: AAA family ATPase, partial [Spirochaetales bacterium]|nr:AAA family ATPase [Spirochaetales bacterium]